MRIAAPAKINLYLRVAPPRQDGFHPLLSWMVTVGLFDTLVLVRRRVLPPNTPGRAIEDARFSLVSDHPSLPTDGRNLVVKVALALADELRQTGSRVGEGTTADADGVSAFLGKRIPAGAGLGGGSSDAAATLIGLNRLWRMNWSAARLSDFAARFGSDLSFFFHGPSSVCTSRGEVVRPIGRPNVTWATLVLPKIEMPTPAVYRRFDEMKLGREQDIRNEPDWTSWVKMPARELMGRLVNDLEAPALALCPQLGELRALLEHKFGQVVRMSGSGSSLFTLCDEQEQARKLSNIARNEVSVDALAVQVAPQVGDPRPDVSHV